MIQPYLFRDALRIECSLCDDIIQQGDGEHAPLAGGICEECERIEQELREAIHDSKSDDGSHSSAV